MKTEHTFYLTAREDYAGEVQFTIFPTDMATYGYVTVATQTVDIEINPPEGFDIRQSQISLLEKQRQKAMADHQVFMDQIEGRIQSLRCIEMKPEGVIEHV